MENKKEVEINDLFEKIVEVVKPKDLEKCETAKELTRESEPIKPVLKTPNLVAAINQVTREVRNIEKNSTVGVGQNAFNAVSDKDVKFNVGQAMERAGLAIIPISIDPIINFERWEVSEQWGTQPAKMKRKKEIFTEVKTKYLLMHESGQSVELAGYGQGVDTMDKGAGKATTYALKYALLYLFMIPTGKIDDADKTQPQKEGDQAPQKSKQTLNDGQFLKAIAAIEGDTYTKDELRADYLLTEAQEKKLPK